MIVAFVIVVLIVVAGIGVYLVINNGSSDGSEYFDSYPTGRLWVLGNANNDDYINQNDVEYINNIISGFCKL
jgi:iron complex transport system substrate-binding protein